MLKNGIYAVKLVFRHTGVYAIGKIMMVFCTALTTPLSVWILKKMVESIEYAIASAGWNLQVLFLIGIYIALNLWGMLNTHYSNLLQLRMQEKLKSNLLTEILNKVDHISYSDIERSENQDLFSRLHVNPHEMVLNIFDLILEMVQYSIAIIGTAIVLAEISIWYFIVFIVILIPALYCDFRSTATVNRMHNEQTHAERELQYYEGLLSDKYALHELSMMNAVEYVQGIWKNNADIVTENYMKTTSCSQKQQLYSTQLLAVWVAAILFLSLHSLCKGVLSVSGLIAVVNAVTSIGAMEYDLAWALTSLSRKTNQIAYVRKLFEMDNEKRGYREIQNKKYQIVFDKVSFKYPDTEKYIISDLSLTINPGEKISIVGPNGAGKSTVIKLICGLYVPDSGTIKINGIDIRKLSRKSLKKIRSVVFQDFYRFYSTIRENVAYSQIENMADNEQIKRALANGMALDLMEKHPDTNLGNLEEDGADLSGGQWQKIAIARACFCQSQFLILDEPTAALDPIAESQMYYVFSEILKDYGYIFISHRLASAKMAERILVLDQGTIIEDGSHEELMRKKGFYYAMFMKQSAWYIEKGAEEI